MALTKQQVSVNFQKGLDTKSDPWQVPIGNFLELENSVFTKQGLLQKRNGFQQIGDLSFNQTVTTIDTFNGELTAIGNTIYSYNNSLDNFVAKGIFHPSEFRKLPIQNNSYNHVQSDSVTAPNGLVCSVFSRTGSPVAGSSYAILDEITGQNVVSTTQLNYPGGSVSGPPRVFWLNNYFIIIYPVTVGIVTSLAFIAISDTTLTATSPQLVASLYTPTPIINFGINWDAVVVNNQIIVGYNVSGAGFYCNLINPDLSVPVATQIDNLHQSTCVGAGTDGTNAYFAYWDTVAGGGYLVGVNGSTGNAAATFAPASFVNAIPPTFTVIQNITVTVSNGTVYIIYEWQDSYSYFPATTPTVYNNQIYLVTATTAGVFSPIVSNIVKGAGLASKAFVMGDNVYFAIAYSVGNESLTVPVNTNQGCYFVVQIDPLLLSTVTIVSQYAYQVGNGYLRWGLPSVTVQQFTGTTISNSNVINGIIDTSHLQVGQKIISSAFPLNNTYIESIDSISQITVSRVANTTGSSVFTSDTAQFSYLLKTLIQPVSQPTEITSTPAVYSQAGVNLAKLQLFKESTQTAEIGKNLLMASGFLWGFDGYQTTENGFFIYPDSVYVTYDNSVVGNMVPDVYYYSVCYEWTDNQGNLFRSAPSIPVQYEIKAASIFTGDTSLGSDTIINIASTAGLQVGQIVTHADIPGAGTYITEIISSTSIRISANCTGTTVGANIAAAQITAVSVNVPTLRLTYKNLVNIVVYRYSASEPVFYQITPPTSPTINNKFVDFETITDVYAITGQYGIVGNNILYTTGGILENIVAPPCSALSIFDNRLWLVNSENENIWYSKQVLENTPVEMSDLLSLFVSPTQTFQGGSAAPRALATLDDKLIIFKKDAIYYINGVGPDSTGANSQYSEPILITGTIGSDNPNSLAIIPQGVLSQGNKGIWLLGRDLSTSYIGAPVESFTEGNDVTSAQVIPGTNQVRFGVNTGIMLMYDYFYGQWGTFTGIDHLHTTIYQDLHTFIDQYGRIAQEHIGNYLDISNPVLMKFTTNWFALSGIQGYQRAYFMFLLGKYYSPHKLNVELAYDFDPGFTQATLITPTNYASVYGSDPFYGSSEVFGGASQVEKWRIMLTKQKCDSVQMKVSEIFDASYGVQAGQGLTLSGMNFIIGVKKGYGPISQFNTAG